MNAKKNGNWIASAVSLLIGTACALVLGALFYGAMAYQLADGGAQPAAAQEMRAGSLLALADAQMIAQEERVQRFAETDCAVTTRTYRLAGGVQAQAITARPAAYMARLSQEGYAPQLITGFALAGMEAVYALRGQEALLCARDGDTVYMIAAPADEQTVYALGMSAALE